ncbi:TonB-dependent receptor [Novosphingobium aerophilum]|uniref:TonB-dependent receptor n=1 Tax=Novosphingobium aerophilum TaxID=2839843 RepID=A0A7X1F943_9SPHN|nr:TonB-dependent receptor [Novosphingobium aerophilum]MBC2652677.1 TonB-dependent receptor [Novosphingobium aerophilum]
MRKVLDILLLGVATIAVIPPALAADGAEASAADGTDPHEHTPQDIVVTGALQRSRQDILSGVAVLQGVDLDRQLRASIGDTLARTPGVSATSFGPTASRPVLRGLQGERVRLLSDGIGSIDVSNTSADHAAVVNPLLAERIEVLRGPQSLLYGSSAIGGVVNVIDRRIPTTLPAEPFHVGAVGTFGTAARERALAGTAELALGGGFVAHVDGSYDQTDDLRIGGYALTPALRAQALDTASRFLPVSPDDPNFAANAAVRGVLPNSAAKTWTGGAGLSYIADNGMIGLSYTRTDSLYGIPLRFATEPGQTQEAPRLQLLQDRFDVRAAINPGGKIIDKVLLRVGYADYQHSELEPDGAVGTTFFNKGVEARLELTQAAHGAWRGATGVQFVNREFNVVGDEAFLPKNSTRQVGLFTLQTFDFGAWKMEAGARLEHARLESQPATGQAQFARGVRSFDAVSLSGGASYQVVPGWRLGLNLSRTERAPAAEELFANGPHAGTEAFEIGDPDLKLERASSVEAVLRGQGDGYSVEVSAYHTWFDNFIYMARTGGVEDGLPVYQIGQANARWYGFEVQGEVTLARIGDWTAKADALGDYVHATIDGFGPAPQIPPLRVQGGLGASTDRWDLRTEVEHVTAQTRVATNETATPAYTMVNASVGWRPWGEDRPVTFLLSANNLFNVTARRHASFLKDYAPLAGRDIRITARLEL